MIEHLCTATGNWSRYEHVSAIKCGCISRVCFKCNSHIMIRPRGGCKELEEMEVDNDHIDNQGRLAPRVTA